MTRARALADKLPGALVADLRLVSSQAAATNGRDAAIAAPALRILIVDDHAIMRSGLKALLSDEFQGVEFGEAADGPQAFAQLRAHAWDVAVLDISLPGRSGLDLLKELKAEWPRLHVLVLSGHKEDQLALRALKAGAEGYLTKESAPDELARAVRKILDGGHYVSAALAEQLASEANHGISRVPHEALSDREYDVTCRIASGKTVSEIADEMSLSVKTISTYRMRILQKLHVRNNAEIVQYALRNSLVVC